MQKLPQDRSEQEQRDLAKQRRTTMNELSKNKQLSEDIARNLRCSGVNAHVVEVVAYEVVIDSHGRIVERLQRYKASGSDAPAPVCQYERGD